MGHKVSIVILADKTEHLSECMESVLKQNHQDIEVICVTDSSNKDIFDRVHQHQDKRVRYLDLNEGELAEGYNKALEQATGEFVLLLNSDSILKPEMVEKMLAAADKSDIIISGYTEVQDNGNTNNVRYSNDFKKSPLTVQKQKNIYDLMFPGPWNKLIRLDLVKKNKLTLERTEGFYTFVQFLFLCFCYAKDIKVIDDALLRSPNHVFRESFSDEKTYINLIKQIDSVFQQIKKRNLGSCWDAFTATGRQLLRKIIVSHPVWRLRQLLPLIQKNMSPDAFDRIFYQDRSFYACKAVAIIIPAYNAEATLARCLDSACQQTLKDIEIICIDDGSTDDTLNILNEYARKDNRITVLHQENSGQAIARNKGLRVAAGEYIQFLDADDYLDPDACEILYLYSRLADLDMCLLMSTLRNGNGDKIESWAAPGANLPNLLKVVKFVTFNKNSLGTRIAELCHAPWATFYKRRFLLNYNISFINKRITYCEDLPFFIICVLKANNIGMFTSPVYNYVRGGRNTMTA
ncbi:MAG: glycosyltransferase family 2 protein, partial [Pseudomonadota bacterium]|nr:glycosyltransferase family 2 protein [Pseudomonadota bacterium]